MAKKTLYIFLYKNRVFLHMFILWLIESMATEAAGAEGRLHKERQRTHVPYPQPHQQASLSQLELTILSAGQRRHVKISIDHAEFKGWRCSSGAEHSPRMFGDVPSPAQERLKRSLWDEGQRVGGKKCKHFVVASVLFSRAWRSASTQPNIRH